MAPLPGPVCSRPPLSKTDPLYLPVCLFHSDSVWVTVSSSSQGELRRNEQQLQIETQEKWDGLHRGCLTSHFGAR